MELFLLRHGRTKANEDHLYCGSTDWYLSPAGIEELRALASTRPLPRFDVAADTGMHRTRETADILCRAARRVTLPSLVRWISGFLSENPMKRFALTPTISSGSPMSPATAPVHGVRAGILFIPAFATGSRRSQRKRTRTAPVLSAMAVLSVRYWILFARKNVVSTSGSPRLGTAGGWN